MGYLTKTTRDFASLASVMQNAASRQFPSATSSDASEFTAEDDLGLLRDILRLLPTGITVQDEQGRFLLINDAAASQLGVAAGSKHLDERRQKGLQLLRDGRAAVAEVPVAGNGGEPPFFASLVVRPRGRTGASHVRP